ncbi:hypothetical protein BK124_22190 [Paenibacillus amylolyticus]|nr:hypothetical protein BK124_22190 [Paenibacillus amylolyticus]
MNDISSTKLFAQERRGQKKPEEAERAPLSSDFPLEEGNQKNLGITAIGRLFCHRSGKCKPFSLELKLL